MKVVDGIQHPAKSEKKTCIVIQLEALLTDSHQIDQAEVSGTVIGLLFIPAKFKNWRRDQIDPDTNGPSIVMFEEEKTLPVAPVPLLIMSGEPIGSPPIQILLLNTCVWTIISVT